jgi:hypothetical protein
VTARSPSHAVYSCQISEKILRVVASSISTRANVPIKNIFINHRYARSGMVFDAGEIVKW